MSGAAVGIDDDETVRWRGSRATRLLVVPVVLTAVGWALAAGLLGGPALFLGGRTAAVGVVALVTLVAAVALLTQVQTTRNAEYVVTDRALYVDDGATFTRPRRVDRALIRGVAIEEMAFERTLDLGVVVVETETDEIWIHGLADAEGAARAIREAAVGDGET